jgi:hypothetical protein
MTDKEYILKLMHRAFLDIRVASHAHDSHTCFILSDVFHNVPLQMNQADKDGGSYAGIVTWIREKCEQRKCLSWFENATTNISQLP